MEKNENKASFYYSYSAQEQTEIKAIREKYLPEEKKEENKLEKLRRLDASVTKKGTVVSLILGVLGALIMGFGMSLVMTDLSVFIGIGKPLIVGIAVGILGMLMAIAAYPVYLELVKRERARLAPVILQLTEELIEK